MTAMPKFALSPFFVPEPDNWHLLPGAPQEIVDEFNEYMENDRIQKEEGKDI